MLLRVEESRFGKPWSPSSLFARLFDYSFVSLSRWTRNLEETCSVTPSLYTRPFYILSSTHENCQTGRIFPSARNVVAEAIKTGHPGVIRLRHVRTIERASPFGRKKLGAGNGLLDYKTDTLRRCINPAVYWPARNKASEASPCSAPGLIGLTGFARISFTHAPSFGASTSINPDFVSISRRRDWLFEFARRSSSVRSSNSSRDFASRVRDKVQARLVGIELVIRHH